jgi:E3 ubiquitin-protein ligase UBR7
VNGRNRYNDNFNGIFCVCKKVYPPQIPEDIDEEDEEKKKELAELMEDMIQCPICEDWFHPSV